MATTTTGADLLRPFDRLSRADILFAGGKGANLGELTAAGLPVPPGFVVGAPAVDNSEQLRSAAETRLLLDRARTGVR